jgi:Glycolipid transfer protein (GLTP)
LGELEPNGKTHGICYEAYDLTLAPYHPWIIRKGATVAMYALPTRDQLINKVCDDVNAAFAVLPAMLQSSKLIYDRTQDLYTVYDLHGLP